MSTLVSVVVPIYNEVDNLPLLNLVSMLVDDYLASVAPGAPVVPGELEPFAGIGRFPLRARCATLAWRAARTALAAADA